MSFFGLLGIAFIVLQLSGQISWPWIWVTSPLWGGGILWILAIFVGVLAGRRSQRRKRELWDRFNRSIRP